MASTYTWSLQSGTLPTGLTLATGETDLSSGISGTPTVEGNYTFTVRITNDVSGDYFDQIYNMTVDNMIELTPNLGLPIEVMFDPLQNSKLMRFGADDLTEVVLEYGSQYIPARLMRFRANLDGSEKTWEIPAELTRNIHALGRKYTWRITNNPNVYYEVTIV